MSYFEFYGWRVAASTNEKDELILRVSRQDGRHIESAQATGVPGEDSFVAFTPKEETRWFINYYRHNECMTEWEDEWSCTCNDKCPSCGAEIEPYKSEDADTGDTTQHHDPKED